MRIFYEHLFWWTSRNSLFWKCVHKTEKEKKLYIRSFNFPLKSSFFQHEYQKKVKLLVFLFHVQFLYNEFCICMEYFFGVVRNISFRTWSTKYVLQLTKGRSKNQQRNMSYERALNFSHWKMLSENCRPKTFDFFTNTTRIIVIRYFYTSLLGFRIYLP